MNLKTLKPEHLKELQRIQKSVPKAYYDNLMVKKQPGLEMLETLKEAVNDPSNTFEQRKKAQLIIDSGYLEKEVEEINEMAEKRIEGYITREIAKSVRLGRLPKKRELSKKINRIIKEKHGLKKASD